MADEVPTTIILRPEARARGLKRYFTGKPCKRGHVSERLVSSKACVQCALEWQKNWRLDNPEQAREKDRRENSRRDPARVAAWLREARRKHPDRYREYDRRAYEKKSAGSDYQKRRYARLDKQQKRE